MTALRVVSLLLAAAAVAALASANPHGVRRTPGPLVSVSVEIDGEPAPLYPAPDGSGRFYLEAQEGERYSLTLANGSGRRLGVVLTVDGLNAISGTRDFGRGRMYVLDPWQSTRVRGWRSSMQEVREFTFVDEQASYAARSGKANRKMGWIELAVYREQEAVSLPQGRPSEPTWPETAEDRKGGAPAAAPSGASSAYPGTGWGSSAHDPVVLVDFRPELNAAQSVTLRYEYRSGLVALGVLPHHAHADRLGERDRADPGFAEPPLW